MKIIQKINPCLWYSTNAEEAVQFYLSVFKNSEILRTSYYGTEGFEVHGMPEGSILTIDFLLEGNHFVALNGGARFEFNEAVSFVVNCQDQNEIDYYWDKLCEGGDERSQQCGWLKDKFGLSWQISSQILDEMLFSDDKEKAGRAMTAMLQMKKLIIKELEDAYYGRS